MECQHHPARSCTVCFHTVIVDVLQSVVPVWQQLPENIVYNELEHNYYFHFCKKWWILTTLQAYNNNNNNLNSSVDMEGQES